jgi:WD40 repeat protein
MLQINFEEFKIYVGNMDFDIYVQLSERLSKLGQAMKESRACFSDIPAIAVASNMFPYLESRTDRHNFALVSKEINKAVTEHKDLTPPWPEGKLTHSSIYPHSRPTFSHDGEFIACGNHRGAISIWSRRKGLVASWRGHINGYSSVCFSPCSNLLLSTGQDKRIKLWDLDNDNLCLWTQQDVELHDKIAFSPIGDVFATFGINDKVFLWNTSDGSLSKTLTTDIEVKYGVALSPDGQMLAVCGTTNAIELWDLCDDSGSTATILDGHYADVLAIAYSPDGKFLASASYDNTIKIWDVANQQCIQTLTGHTGYVTSISYLPDGKFLASGSSDQDIRLWSTANGNCVETIKAGSTVYSTDGKMLLTKEGLSIVRLRYVNPGHA